MSLPFYTVDAFTKSPFSGNQAAVCLVGDREVSENTMQSFAAEMNVAETAYLEFAGATNSFKGGSYFRLRWFTPTSEVPLCGHATLASAAVVFFECGNSNQEITFSTLSGDLKVTLHDDNEIMMDFPSNEPTRVDREDWQDMIEAVMGSSSDDVEEVFRSSSSEKLVIRLNEKHSVNHLASVSPNLDKMMSAHSGSAAEGVIVTAVGRASDGYDFVSRYFDPWSGVPEDPVTGSAHTVLGPFWSRILRKKDMKARQCSKRGGEMRVTVYGDRTHLNGSAVIIVRGTVTLPT